MSCSCCCRNDATIDETATILQGYQQKCRQGREKRQRKFTEKVVISYLKTAFCSSGYWVPSTCCYFYVVLLLFITVFQLVYDVVTVFYCPNFDCRFLIKTHDSTKKNPTRSLQNATYTLASCGGLCSYLFMVISLYIAANKRKSAARPRDMSKDLGKKRLYILGLILTALMFLFLASVGIFFYLTREEIKKKYYCVLVSGVGSQFVTQWTGIVACLVFGCSCFALGSFSKDVERRIREMKTENINSPIIIHREFASIVGDTVKAFSFWFVLHWFFYGITTILALIVIVRHFGEETDTLKKVYLVLFLVVHLLMFVVPCGFAAYITSVCGGIPSKLNNTTEENWPENHIFRDRVKLQLFVSYARESSVSFKIGRITFTSTLAWISFFFGFSGLIFRFF